MLKRWITFPTKRSCLIVGPRRSGKTTTLKHRYPDLPYATLDDLDYLDAAKRDPKGFVAFGRERDDPTRSPRVCMINPEGGGSGHTMRVCRQHNVPVFTQKDWF